MISVPPCPALQAIPAARPGSPVARTAPRQDRLPVVERIDLPEIQESSASAFDEASPSPPGGVGMSRRTTAPVSGRRRLSADCGL